MVRQICYTLAIVMTQLRRGRARTAETHGRLEIVERTLVLMRHAKSDYPEGVPDHERPLAERGRRDAPRMGAWLRDGGYLPDRVVCSTAMRARQTWELIAPLFPAATVSYEPRLYGASVFGLLMLVREVPDDAATALLIGHNPAIGELASALPDEHETRFPTASVAVLRIPGGWPSAVPGEATRLALASPRSVTERQ
jgi:phosphohistidine phosphatase